MEVLKTLIKERKALTNELKESVKTNNSIDSKKKIYFRRGDLEHALDEKLRKEQEIRQENEDKRNAESLCESNHDRETCSIYKKQKLEKPNEKNDVLEHSAVESKLPLKLLPVAEVKKKLRSLGKPVTLFGESNNERQLRLVEAQQESLSQNHDLSISSEYAVDSSYCNNDGSETLNSGKTKDDDDDDEKRDSGEDDNIERPADDNQYVYRFFKRMLKLWERDLSSRPETVKRTAQGKIATKTMKQCKDYIRPLFKQCKSKEVPSHILEKLSDMVRFCEEKDFVQANDAYISVAIGNAAWPIGVTMVGIHERKGREKINSSKVAHVMNNETQRKYLTSVKRLMTYCQNISDALPSKRVT